jgi:glycogen debranching enzyme
MIVRTDGVSRRRPVSTGVERQMETIDRREWLSANGLGGYASSTVSGANTRRYHGLLVAALTPPGQREVLLSRLDETVVSGGETYELSASVWQSGDVAPQGWRHLTAFVANPAPAWEYRVGAGRLIKRVVGVPGRNATAISYRLEGGPPVRLEIKILANGRGFHGETHGHPDWHFQQRGGDQGHLEVAAWEGAPSWRLTWRGGDQPQYRPAGEWYWGYAYPEEAARGLPSVEDNYCLGSLEVQLASGDRLDLLASADAPALPPAVDREPELAAVPGLGSGVVEGWPGEGDWPSADALADALMLRTRRLVASAGLPATATSEALVAAADQFLVRRASTGGSTVIAGYHWFDDWGRDTMIALPGLTLTTGRFAEAREILRTFARYLDQGMLPNQFPEAGAAPEYNTVDATLWWFHALDRYVAATGDLDLAREQLPLLVDVVEWHLRGTRYGIVVDPTDGLLWAGEPGVQLTWMDARVGERVVTPRHGKPIEIQGLWYNALGVLTELLERLGQEGVVTYATLAERARQGMQAFWYDDGGYLYDVLGPDGQGDPTLRPNQLVALGLPRCAFDQVHAASALAEVEAALLTPYGPRTLAPNDPAYVGRYAGDVTHRDGSYHQGPAWPWLIGPYADAMFALRGDTPATRQQVEAAIAPLLEHLERDGCLGSVSELFDGDAPHTPNGAVAQAWSVAELLRVYARLAGATAGTLVSAGASVPVRR